MEWLCRLVGHPQGRGLDPFAGSGSTLRAARSLGLDFDGIERDPTFAEVARYRAGIHDEAPSSPATPPQPEPPAEGACDVEGVMVALPAPQEVDPFDALPPMMPRAA